MAGGKFNGGPAAKRDVGYNHHRASGCRHSLNSYARAKPGVAVPGLPFPERTGTTKLSALGPGPDVYGRARIRTKGLSVLVQW